jgi:fused signal recognition particle receptor
MNIFSRLRDGLSKTRAQITGLVGAEEGLDEDFFETLEDALVSADMGIDLTLETMQRLRDDIRECRVETAREAYAILKQTLVKDLRIEKHPDEFPPKPWVVLVLGVNGVGKTTTIGKLAHEYRREGKKVMLGAADTFRAGAIEQLRIWAQRTESAFIAQHEGADAASVAFDAMESARARGVDVLLLDTAGRLHSKTNLMNELEKIVRVIKRNTPHAPNEVLMVVDATTGQNAIKQAEAFNKVLPLTGLVITKLDGTAKGGIALALTRKIKAPIRKIGVGEQVDDLQDFDPEAYVDAMFGSIDT